MTMFLIGVIIGFLGGCWLTLTWAASKPIPEPPKVACWILESPEGIASVKVLDIHK